MRFQVLSRHYLPLDRSKHTKKNESVVELQALKRSTYLWSVSKRAGWAWILE